MSETLGLYPGSFDPITNGHLDIIKRSLVLCSKLVVAVGVHPGKKTLFTDQERVNLIRDVLEEEGLSDRVTVQTTDGLMVTLAQQLNAACLIRGIRSVSDFEYEINLANINKVLCPTVETLFLPTQPEMAVVSSSAAKEIAKHRGDISKFVPKSVANAILTSYGFPANPSTGFVKFGENQ